MHAGMREKREVRVDDVRVLPVDPHELVERLCRVDRPRVRSASAAVPIRTRRRFPREGRPARRRRRGRSPSRVGPWPTLMGDLSSALRRSRRVGGRTRSCMRAAQLGQRILRHRSNDGIRTAIDDQDAVGGPPVTQRGRKGDLSAFGDRCPEGAHIGIIRRRHLVVCQPWIVFRGPRQGSSADAGAGGVALGAVRWSSPVVSLGGTDALSCAGGPAVGRGNFAGSWSRLVSVRLSGIDARRWERALAGRSARVVHA